jgi:exopolysaccharide production protein ExoQ
VTPALACVTVLLIGSLPFVLRMLARHRTELASYVKFSALARMEIWDFMTTRVLERPLPGWGFGVAGELPITPAESSHYVALHDHSIYPHNQWLELWVETGAASAAIGLGFVLLVLLRVRHLTATVRPFAYATIASALAISFVNFEVKTDSWWAAMTAGAWLLIAADSRADETPPCR